MTNSDPKPATTESSPSPKAELGASPPSGASPRRVQITRAEFAGPLPPPDILGGYERIVPGSANRLIRLLEDEANHRRAMERAVVEGSLKEKSRGQFFGLVIGLVAIIAGAIVAALGQPAAGATIGGVGVAGIVAVFVIGRTLDQRIRSENPDEKSDRPQAE